MIIRLHVAWILAVLSLPFSPGFGSSAAGYGPREGGLREDAGWRALFDGSSLAGWKSTSFGGEGEVYVEGGSLILEMGSELTGVTWDGGELPLVNYEISLEAMKLDGNDFFCGLTFPVQDSFCSLIVGGWGGSLVGLSSLDGMDAANNETARSMRFTRDRWYRILVRVTRARIEAWIDGEKAVDANTAGRAISLRPEVELSRPLGIAAWLTRAALRDIRIRPVEPPE